MVQTKEEIAAGQKKYRQTPAGIKARRIANCKFRGIISLDWDATYNWFMNTLNCENPECNVILTTDRYPISTTKCLDHDHNIINSPNIRGVLCHQCNLNDKTSNTSGTSNVYRHPNGWVYQRAYNGKKHSKWFKTKEEACAYKLEFELTMRKPL
tara:strand:+ start:50 stop:511 length:462 start_codon:yes stop_codon:yes gene_type:complete